MLEQCCEGVIVDGCTSFVPGQENSNEEVEEKGEEEQEMDMKFEQNPTSSNSRLRTCSTSITTISPAKKTKGPMVKVMRGYLNISSKQVAESNQYLKQVCTEKQERKASN